MKSIKIKRVKYELKFDYYITDEGKVWSDRTKKYLSFQDDKNGYKKVQMMSKDGKRHRYSVHRLVLENFNPVENMDKLQVNHIDGDKTNNNLSNLEWVTPKQNIKHAVKNNLHRVPDSSKLSEDDVKEIIKLLLLKEFTQKELGVKYDVNSETIGRIKRHQAWKHLTDGIDFN